MNKQTKEVVVLVAFSFENACLAFVAAFVEVLLLNIPATVGSPLASGLWLGYSCQWSSQTLARLPLWYRLAVGVIAGVIGWLLALMVLK